MNSVRFAGLLAILLAASIAHAGTLHPDVVKVIAETPPDQPVSVIVHMTEQAPIEEINQNLRSRSATRLERNQAVISALQEVQHTQDALKTDLETGLRSGGVIGYTSYWISNMLVVYALPAVIEQIAERDDVGLIEINFEVELIEPIESAAWDTGEEGAGVMRGIGVTPGVRALRAPEVWYELGFTGEGRIIACLDTGVDGNHPALNTKWRGYGGAVPWQHAWLDVLGYGSQFPADYHGHGTHVMGTIGGLAPDDTIGVAWGAKWISTNAINQGTGGAFDNSIITCLQWFANPDGDPNTIDDVPDVVQNSWGVNQNFPGYTSCDSRWWNAMDNCEAAGVVLTWSAGNEGPGSQSHRSPADRATTLTNAFSVGAINATDYNWPYPIANFSSRGPTACNVPPEQKIKPEVVAPGVNVYSSVPGGGYQGGWSGTSMAGPHVAGIVALMRQANPNLDVDTIKNILMETARDLGTTGEDNTYGWGMVDAYAAVQAAMTGFGQIEGFVRNASYDNVPLQGANVQFLDTGYSFSSDQDGYYIGVAAPDTYTARVTMPGFAPQNVQVIIEPEEITVQDFALTDIAGPLFSDVTGHGFTKDTAGPYSISATVTDYSTVQEVKIYHRVNNGQWQESTIFGVGDVYSFNIPGQPSGTKIDFYLKAWDGIGLMSIEPFGAPLTFHSLFITDEIYNYECEDPGDPSWTMGIPGDDATTGHWERVNPVGTEWNGHQLQPSQDHTPDPGVKCYVTGQHTPGQGAGYNDVDEGCTTLLTPIFDFSGVERAFITYHRWWSQSGNAADDDFVIDISDDGGVTWEPVERIPGSENWWQEVNIDVSDYVDLTDQVMMRFVACDLGSQGLVEGAVDDFSVEVFAPLATSVDGLFRPYASLSQNSPNPFSGRETGTEIRFSLSNPADATLQIFDASGRLVRTLLDAPLTSGSHALEWDGRDDQGRSVGSGMYFYRLKAGAFEQSRQMTILR